MSLPASQSGVLPEFRGSPEALVGDPEEFTKDSVKFLSEIRIRTTWNNRMHFVHRF